MPEHTVRQGDCIYSIAQRYGFSWETIWNHSNNAELRNSREDPGVLYPGDVVFIPETEERQESCATGQRHRFKVLGAPLTLRLQLMERGEPLADETYVLQVDGQEFSGTTDGEGRIEHPISPNASSARLLIGEDRREFPVNLGHIDPIDEISGVQERLNNLGFNCGDADGELDQETEDALRQFQHTYELEETGEIDDATRSRLLEVYGS